MQALILTGGLGTRLRPLTLTTLKPLLPIANVPFLSYPLSSLRRAGVREAILCTSDSLQPYRGFIKAQKKLGTKVLCSQETQKLGTGGAIKNAESFLSGSPFFAMNGDSLTDLNFAELLKFHRAKRALATLALIPVEDPSQYGLVLTDPQGRVMRFIEKPSELDLNPKKRFFINGGMYIFEREVLGLIPEKTVYSVERELFPLLIKKGWPIFGFSAKPSTYWLDIGAPRKYLQGNVDVISRKLSHAFPALSARSFGSGTKIHPSAKIGKDVVIGSHCRIGENASLKNCLLLNHVRVENDAALENCIIGNHSLIGRHSQILRAQVLGDRSSITPYSQL